MNKKSLLIFLIFAGLSLSCFSQIPNFEQEVVTLEKNILEKNNPFVLNSVDSLLQNKQITARQIAILKLFKTEALLDSELFDEAKFLSNELLSNTHLPDTYLVRLWITQSLINEVIGNFEESMRYLVMGENYYSNHLQDRFYGILLYRKSSLYRVSGKGDEALSLALEAKAYGEKHNYKDIIASANLLVGILYTRKDYNLSLESFTKAQQIYFDLKDYEGATAATLSISKLNSIFKKSDKAKSTLLKAFQNHETYGKDSILFGIIFSRLSELYELEGRFDSALFYNKKANIIDEAQILNRQKLSIQRLENVQEKMRRQFDVEKMSIDLAQSKNEKRWLMLAIILFAFIVAVISFLLYKLYRKNLQIKKQRNAIQETNLKLSTSLSQKTILLQELNHRVKNNLSLILSLTSFHMQDIKEPQLAAKFQDLENRIKAIAITHDHFIYSEDLNNDSKIALKDYLAKIISTLTMATTKKIEYNLDVVEININMDTVLPIGILINELVNNSIKHAKTKLDKITIDVQVMTGEEKIYITYKDSGIKFGKPGTQESLGLFIIESMVQQLAGTYTRTGSEYHFTLNVK